MINHNSMCTTAKIQTCANFLDEHIIPFSTQTSVEKLSARVPIEGELVGYHQSVQDIQTWTIAPIHKIFGIGEMKKITWKHVEKNWDHFLNSKKEARVQQQTREASRNATGLNRNLNVFQLYVSIEAF